MRIPALILAGGEARRMGGGDKPLLALGGRPILAHVLDRLGAAHADIAISANGDPARFAHFGRAVLPDEVPGRGPLGGVLAGLDWAETLGAELLLTVPGDAPFLPRDLAARLAPAPAMAASGGKRHPPASLWPVAAAPALRAHLAGLDPNDRRAHSVIGFGARISMRVVSFPVAPIDPFLDVDTPSDLDRAASLMGEGAC